MILLLLFLHLLFFLQQCLFLCFSVSCLHIPSFIFLRSYGVSMETILIPVLPLALPPHLFLLQRLQRLRNSSRNQLLFLLGDHAPVSTVTPKTMPLAASIDFVSIIRFSFEATPTRSPTGPTHHTNLPFLHWCVW